MSPLTIGYGLNASGRDYIQDTSNVRVYHNTTKLTPDSVIFDQNLGTKGLKQFSNTIGIWCSVGDSIVLEIDSNEVNFTTAYNGERFLRTIFKVWKNAPNLVSNLQFNYDTQIYDGRPELTAIYQGIQLAGNNGVNNYLGTAYINNNGLLQSFYIGGKLRVSYIVQ